VRLSNTGEHVHALCARTAAAMSAQSPMMSVSLFQKSLQDLVKGIRTHKRDPSAFISQGIAEIKQELKTTDPFVKAQAVCGLLHLLARTNFRALCVFSLRCVHRCASLRTFR
jgi:hypothetical protein